MGFKPELYTEHYYRNLVLGAKEWYEGGLNERQVALLDKVDVTGDILDIGCGRGDVLRYCLEQGATSVTGIDFSLDAISLSNATLKGKGTLLAGDALDLLPTLDAKYDTILMFDSIEHIPASEIDAIITQFDRLLKPGGKLLVNTPYYKRYEDYIAQGEYIRPSPTDKNPLTIGMHCTKYTRGRLLDLMMNHGYKYVEEGAVFTRMEDVGHIVVAYYTENTPYEEEISHLRESLIKWEVPYYFKPVTNLSKWEFNCGMKPAFILECLERFKGKTLMYTDADSVLQAYPEYIRNFQGDIAVRYLGSELLSGTIVLNDNERTNKLVREWVYEQSLTPNDWDQRVLARVLEDIEVEELPLEYIQIFDHSVKCKNPVVIHNQASRRFKNMVHISGTTEIHLPSFVKGWRKLADGTLVLLRPDARSIKYLDENYCRVKGELKWHPVALNKAVLEPWRGKHKCEITIIGKGPSLDRLTAAHITGPTIALNEAFAITQGLGVQYGTQLDAWMGPACLPSTGHLFCSARAHVHYKGNKNVTLTEPRQLGLAATPGSLSYAIALAELMGATSIRLACFDALVTGDCDYAKAVGYKPTNMGDPKRFLKHQGYVDKAKVPVTMFIPE